VDYFGVTGVDIGNFEGDYINPFNESL